MANLWLRGLFLVLAGALFFGAIGLVATWAPDEPVDDLKARWARPPSRFVDVQGLQVHVRDEGPHDDPAPIVLLHGTSGSLHTWEGWAQALRAKRRVIRLDLPGFALTGPNRENDYSTDSYVRFVRAAMDQLGVERFVLAGNALGGQIAWAAAAAMPDRVERLILVNAEAYPPETLTASPQIPLGLRLARIPVLRRALEYTLPRGIVESSLRDLYGDPAKVTAELVDLYYDMTLRAGNRRALARRIEQGYTGNPALLKEIKAPTLVLWGGRDRLQPIEVAQRLVRDIPGARLVVLDGLGHLPQEEDPSRTVAEVRRFLES